MEFSEGMKKDLSKDKFNNFRDRIWFIKFWVEKMKKMSDREWSLVQRKLIDAQFESSRIFCKSNYHNDNCKKALDNLLRVKKR